jgi:hypothetical protein
VRKSLSPRTSAELSKELPPFSLVRMLMDIEEALVDLAAANDIVAEQLRIHALING